MKKLFALCAALVLALSTTACGAQASKTIEGTLPEIIQKIYQTADVDDETRTFLENTVETVTVEPESAAYYFGTDQIQYIEAVASEPRMSSIAFSVCLMRVPEEMDIDAAKEDIRNKADPRKWICVEAEDVLVESEGNLILLVMTGENGQAYVDAFHALAQ